eukprot:TRINITY_DN7662_c0_g1_i1.p1 TRINITY_DN7662_c0_g1~~TRINITY_DN7662_c0_g1_i1.p1  ORF type:complete len:324 (+),score=42.65 TRINITY_DN7662_c0_g1_i1:82-1053(+)
MSKKHKHEDLGLFKHMIAGSCAGVFSKTMVQPFDLIKTRMQVNSGLYKGVVDAFRQIIKAEGLKGLYTGLAPNLLGSGAAWGVNFYIYNLAKQSWRKYILHTSPDSKEHLGPLPHLLCAACGGVATSLATNPIWLIKTRLQVQSKNLSAPQYTGIVDCFTRIVHEEGPLALYKGLVPALSLVSNGALQFMAYEELKRFTIRYVSKSETSLGSMHFAAMGFFAKAFSATITYPLQVTRARLYQGRKPDRALKIKAQAATAAAEAKQQYYTSMRGVIFDILRNESPLSFYRGLFPHLLKTAPLSALMFFGYETTLRFLEAQNHRS